MIHRNTVNNINEMYITMCKDLVTHGKIVNNTIELSNYVITVDDISQCVINVRNLSLNYMAAELLWYLTGRNDTAFIGKYASLWTKLTDDGVTNNSAYGYILQKKHGFNQIEKMIELLKVDPNSRRAVMNINVPNEKVIETKDEMCTICLNYQIRNGKLNCSALLRSNDIYTGVVYDATYFILLQKYIADRLNVGYGSYTHMAFSLHAYDRHIDKVTAIAKNSKFDETVVNINHKRLFNLFNDIMTDVENNSIKPEDAFYKYDIYEIISSLT